MGLNNVKKALGYSLVEFAYKMLLGNYSSCYGNLSLESHRCKYSLGPQISKPPSAISPYGKVFFYFFEGPFPTAGTARIPVLGGASGWGLCRSTVKGLGFRVLKPQPLSLNPNPPQKKKCSPETQTPGNSVP